MPCPSQGGCTTQRQPHASLLPAVPFLLPWTDHLVAVVFPKFGLALNPAVAGASGGAPPTKLYSSRCRPAVHRVLHAEERAGRSVLTF